MNSRAEGPARAPLVLMRMMLLEILRCPACGAVLRPVAPASAETDLCDGALECLIGHRYPVVRGVPRLLVRESGDPVAFAALQDQTRRSFGYQWTAFHTMEEAFREGFLTYIHPLGPEVFPGKRGLDAGCGFGRHAYYAAKFGAEMVGVDFSEAIEAARANTAALKDVHLVRADIYHLPFREAARAVTRRLPHRILHGLSLAAACVDWGGFIGPYRLARRLPGVGPLAERAALARVKLYARYPFQVSVADWFDRLATPRRHYYGPEDLAGWATRAGLADVRITPTGKYGWRLHGHRR